MHPASSRCALQPAHSRGQMTRRPMRGASSRAPNAEIASAAEKADASLQIHAKGCHLHRTRPLQRNPPPSAPGGHGKNRPRTSPRSAKTLCNAPALSQGCGSTRAAAPGRPPRPTHPSRRHPTHLRCWQRLVRAPLDRRVSTHHPLLPALSQGCGSTRAAAPGRPPRPTHPSRRHPTHLRCWQRLVRAPLERRVSTHRPLCKEDFGMATPKV
mmetsp:Transcript_55548/g.180266  ORF Transcript_55548/g.180266 Transcript_55548/m.180266 type:complete len:212 (+) Transcript_55548:955-1590(+)